MIQIGLLLPLVVVGAASAVLREYKKREQYKNKLALPTQEEKKEINTEVLPQTPSKVFDDVGELYHYQRVSWYALAFSTSGALFYSPIMLLSLPLLGYNTYHFANTIRHSDDADRKSPMTVFQVIGFTACILTYQPVAASLLLLLSFGSRKLLLQAGNISNTFEPSQPLNPRLNKVWVLREETEIEIPISALQKGDTVVLQQGDIVMFEAKVMKGKGTIKQFSLHKEMKLVPKQQGDKVFPFTQLDSGYLHIQVI